eukprot:758190-Hanusia_phi.AAC.5
MAEGGKGNMTGRVVRTREDVVTRERTMRTSSSEADIELWEAEDEKEQPEGEKRAPGHPTVTEQKLMQLLERNLARLVATRPPSSVMNPRLAQVNVLRVSMPDEPSN